jgi:hypothetical protein
MNGQQSACVSGYCTKSISVVKLLYAALMLRQKGKARSNAYTLFLLMIALRVHHFEASRECRFGRKFALIP